MVSFGPINSPLSTWSTSVNSVHLVLFCPIQSQSVLSSHFSPPWPNLVQFGPFCLVRSIRSTSFPFSLIRSIWSTVVQFGLIQSILPISVHLCPIRFTFILFGPILTIRSTFVYLVHLGLIWSIWYYKWILIDLFCIH